MPTVVAEVGSTASEYHVLAKLATGGMAEIFLARGSTAAGIERYVVLKRILRDKATDAHFVQMFLEEARLAAQLQHPNIAQVLDIGKLGDSYFFTMEYVHGETVRSVLHQTSVQKREIPISCVLSVVAGAAAGLHHAHNRIGVDGRPLGIVHRDVSPSNLMVSYEGIIKVVDFGVAKAENRTTETRTGTVKGKISYLSPEQCRGVRVDRRSDLFSLGIVLWEMLTGRRLYRLESDFEIMSAIVREAPSPPSRHRRALPRELDSLVLRLLAKNPADRYQSADEVVDAVEQMAATLGEQLSQKALGRFMHEQFGTRKEPWLEMIAQRPEVVTITGEPIPSEIASGMSQVGMQLDEIHDLSVRVPYSESSVPMRPSMASLAVAEPKPTQQTMAARPGLVGRQAPVESYNDDDNATVAASPPQRDVLASVPTLQTAAYQLETETSGPVVLPVAVAPVMPVASPAPFMPLASPAPMQAFPPRHITPLPPEPTALTARRTGNGPLLAVLGVATVLCAVFAFVLVRELVTDKKAADDKKAPTMMPSSTPIPDAAAAPSVAPSERPDASAVETVTQPGQAPSDAPIPTSIERIEMAFAEERFSDALTTCDSELDDAGRVDVAATCTIAACRMGDAALAKTWLSRVPSSRRASVIAACKAAGVNLMQRVRPPSSDSVPDTKAKDCAKDPMACQY